MNTVDKKMKRISHLLYPLNEYEAAAVLGLSVQTLRNWRHLRKGPAYYKLSRRILYQEADLKAFQEKNRIDPEGLSTAA